MNTGEMTVGQNSHIAAIEQGWWVDQAKIDLLKQTLCKGASNEEFALFMNVCKHTGLDPFMKQIYPVFRNAKEGDKWVKQMTIQTGIDGLRLIAERTGNYAPGRETTYTYDSNNKLLSATAYVKKRTRDGVWHEVAATAFYAEYVQVFKGQVGQFWDSKPHVMLGKCAESLALKKAFPADCSRLYSHEEMAQADNYIKAEPDPVECVSAEQAKELQELLMQCSPKYIAMMHKGLERQGIQGWGMLPADKFEATVDAFCKEGERYRMQQENEIEVNNESN